jgi:hypothetical protein
VNALAFERIEIARQGSDEGLAFAGFHLGDFALVQHHAADQLHVEVPHIEEAATSLAHHGESRDQQVVKGCALRDLLFKPDSFSGKIDIGEL